MSWKSIVITGLLCIVASPVLAAPQIRVIKDGLSGANQKWKVQIQPDATLLWNNPQIANAEGASLSAEIDLTFSTAVISAVGTASFPDLNNGHNPFTAGLTDGIAIAGNTVFAAVGGPDDTAPLFLPFGGDTDKNNTVNGVDFTELSTNWDPLHTKPQVPGGRLDADFDKNGFVDGADFTALSGNWLKTFWIDALNIVTTGANGTVSWGGSTADGVATSLVAQAGTVFPGLSGAAGSGSLDVGGTGVPEPTTALMLLLGVPALCALRRNR